MYCNFFKVRCVDIHIDVCLYILKPEFNSSTSSFVSSCITSIRNVEIFHQEVSPFLLITPSYPLPTYFPTLYPIPHFSIYLFIYVLMYVCMYVCMYVSIYLSIYLSIYVYIHTHIYLCIYIATHTHIYVCRCR